MATRLILDCDTGTDDAVAIMVAVGHPSLELVAVTTVTGNAPLAYSAVLPAQAGMIPGTPWPWSP